MTNAQLRGVWRLRQVEYHLRYGKLAHERFSFAYYNANKDGIDPSFPVNKCGTMGCAVGEMPAIWPRLWMWQGNNVRKLRSIDPLTGIHKYEWFGVKEEEYNHLFIPECQFPWHYLLGNDATKEAVADNIAEFIDRYRPGKIYVIRKHHDKEGRQNTMFRRFVCESDQVECV